MALPLSSVSDHRVKASGVLLMTHWNTGLTGGGGGGGGGGVYGSSVCVVSTPL